MRSGCTGFQCRERDDRKARVQKLVGYDTPPPPIRHYQKAFCDCLDTCGSDPGVKHGTTRPCSSYAGLQARETLGAGLPRAVGVGRMADEPRAILVSFERELTDDEMRRLHGMLNQR